MFRIRYMVNIYSGRYKYYRYYFICLLCVYIVLWNCLNPNSENTKVSKSSFNLKYVTVHLDLKGSPPKMSYLESILPKLSMYGVNSILVEYEDMFPYWGSIVNVSSKNCYSREELKRFINKAKLLNMEIIPLIQTFGHMEFVLKLEEFVHLREHKKFPTDICPSNPSSLILITTMLKQVIDFHNAIQQLKHIHVGCDEVRKINLCPKCKGRRLENINLFVKHVNEVSSIVKDLSSDTKVLIWGDKFLDIRIPHTFDINNVEVVPWEYSASPKFMHTYYYSLHKNFKAIWIASAFKGADGYNAAIPDIRKRFKNHLSWMRFILSYKFGGETNIYNFKGIILTGWSRYSHMQPQCELLPVAMPSLILNLLLIRTVKKGIDNSKNMKDDLKNMNDCDFFNKYLSVEYFKIYQNYNNTDVKCCFENTFPYAEFKKLFDPTLLFNCRSGQLRVKCTRVGKVNITYLESSFENCNRALKKLLHLKEYLESFMIKYYKTHVIQNYINESIEVSIEEVKRTMNYLNNCTYTQKRYKKVDFLKYT